MISRARYEVRCPLDEKHEQLHGPALEPYAACAATQFEGGGVQLEDAEADGMTRLAGFHTDSKTGADYAINSALPGICSFR